MILQYTREEKIVSFDFGVSNEMLQFEDFHHFNLKQEENTWTDTNMIQHVMVIAFLFQ